MSTGRPFSPLPMAPRERQSCPETGEWTDHILRTKQRHTRFFAFIAVGMIAAISAAYAGGWPDSDDQLAQSAELEKLHAGFHAAVSVHDPVNGDSAEVIAQRIRDAVALWTRNGEITIPGNANPAGNYIGRGDPDDPATCPEPTGDTSEAGQQGTLCTFFKYVSGGMQKDNRFVSLSPAYKTKYVPVRDHHGQWTSSVYFECHYFDVSIDKANGTPLWAAKSHVDLDGEAKKINGRWFFTHVRSSAVSVPVP